MRWKKKFLFICIAVFHIVLIHMIFLKEVVYYDSYLLSNLYLLWIKIVQIHNRYLINEWKKRRTYDFCEIFLEDV